MALNDSEILVAGVILSCSAGMTWIVRAAAYRFGFVSVPRHERWHRKPTALFGGIAIFTSFFVGFLLFVPKQSEYVVLAVCSSGMFLLGLVDDFVRLKPQTKLVAQIVVATAFAYSGLVLPFSDREMVNFLITLLWLVGITNAMNLLDNMDGLCAGVAMIAAAYGLVFCAMEGDAAGVMTATVFIAALGGFLLFNFNPSSIFMGDAGSLFVGFLLAGVNVAAPNTHARSVLSILLFPCLILVIPIFDTALVSVIRKFSGRPISVGGKDHSSQRLVAVGLSERRAVLILYAVSLVSGGIAYLLNRQGFSYTLFFISLFVIGMVLFGVYLSNVKVYSDDADISEDRKDVFQLVADVPYKKYVALIVLDVLLVFTAYYGAYWLRFEGIQTSDRQFRLFVNSFPIVLVLSVISFFVSGLYYDNWRYTGIRDLLAMIKGSFGGAMGSVVVLTFVYRFEGYSRSVLVMYWGILLMLLAGSRLSFRMLTEVLVVSPDHYRRVLIYGAGDGGELLLRELKNNPAMEAKVVGFLDDDPSRLRTKIHGISVLGPLGTAEFWIRRYSVGQIIISSQKIPVAKVSELQEICDRFQVELLRASIKYDKALA